MRRKRKSRQTRLKAKLGLPDLEHRQHCGIAEHTSAEDRVEAVKDEIGIEPGP
jgi:hypothetical protein